MVIIYGNNKFQIKAVVISDSVVIIFSIYPFFPFVTEISLKKYTLCSEEYCSS